MGVGGVPALVVFDSQKFDLKPIELSLCRSILLLSLRLRPLLTGIGHLHTTWKSIIAANPELDTELACEGLQCLESWLDGEDVTLRLGARSNVFLTTLTLIVQICLYSQYLDNSGKDLHQRILQRTKHAGIQGFCTGLLAAAVVSSSSCADELGVNAAWALELAFIVGVHVDHVTVQSAKTFRSIAVRYKSPTTLADIRKILAAFPGTYISVTESQLRLTLITSASADVLIARLEESGITAKELGLCGRFHHEDNLSLLLKFVNQWTFRPATEVRFHVPVRSNSAFGNLQSTDFQHELLRCILVEPCSWKTVLDISISSLTSRSSVLAIGTKHVIPSSIQRKLDLQVNCLNLQQLHMVNPQEITSGLHSPVSAKLDAYLDSSGIAVVGMGIRTSHARSLDEFWQLILGGQSCFEPMPSSRFNTSDLKRSKKGSKLWGTFIEDIDSFDHKFFHNSAREAASMDPQQRILLEVAYQAMESYGYFGSRSEREREIGCYLGACSNDYNDNVACNPAGAFSTLGTLRAFLAGRISHFFEWTGPSLTFDTACSSSAVAIHSACQALKQGDCSVALAGGVSLYTSPHFYQNLEAGGFLSPSGQCRPFDALADGYVRGEGVGLVVLKKLDRAIADGDKIYGVLAKTAVNQNSKSPGITVPSCSSQSGLFESILGNANILPSQIDYVEAHGTGTKVGDPIEFASIYKAIVEPGRAHPLQIGSVKGNIGHLEGASGVVSLIKVLLMLQANTIPPQASFDTLSPNIHQDMGHDVLIARRPTGWDSPFRAAFVNNYGASGSNAAMLVVSFPQETNDSNGSPSTAQQDVKKDMPRLPIILTALSISSLQAYCAVLAKHEWPVDTSLQQVLHALDLTQNHNLPWKYISTASKLEELSHELSRAAANGETLLNLPSARPVVMVIGGQSNQSVDADLGEHGESHAFRKHWSNCVAVLESLGYDIDAQPLKEKSDFVRYQVTLFCLQYCSAQTWIDSGLPVKAIVGHSLGELTALCISGCLSLYDGLRFILYRALIIQDHWTKNRGQMMAVEANLDQLQEALSSTKATDRGSSVRLEIACFNGPSSFVIAGEQLDLDLLQKMLAKHASVRTKRLVVSHGFHSSFAEPILQHLEQLAQSLHMSKARIPVKLCSIDGSTEKPTPYSLTMHVRLPVYYHHTIQRLEKEFGPCIWFDPGPKSPAIGMTRKCVNTDPVASHSFVNHGCGVNELFAKPSQTITELWNLGVPVHNYIAQPLEAANAVATLLPPYQFDKSRHWLKWSNIEQSVERAAVPAAYDPEALVQPKGVISLDKDVNCFNVNIEAAIYKYCVDGHRVLDRPLCPASMYMEIALQAMRMLSAQLTSFVINDIDIASPLGLGSSIDVQLTLSRNKQIHTAWDVEMKSSNRNESNKAHVDTWKINFTAALFVTTSPHTVQKNSSKFSIEEFRKLSDSQTAEIVQGKIVYDVFSRVTNYATYYKKIWKMVSSRDSAIANVSGIDHSAKELKTAQTSPIALDNILQVAGLQVNCLQANGDRGSVFVCGQVGQIMTDKVGLDWSGLHDFQVCLRVIKHESRTFTCDLAVFLPEVELPSILILGAKFVRLPMSALTRMLDGSGPGSPQSQAQSGVVTPKSPALELKARLDGILATKSLRTSSLVKIQEIVAQLLGISTTEVSQVQDFATLGVDSILATEILSDIHQQLGVEVSNDKAASVDNVRGLAQLVDEHLGKTVEPSRLPDVNIPQELGDDAPTLTPDASSPGSTDSVSSKTIEFWDTLRNCLELDVTEITSNSKLSDLGADSLMLMELIGELRQTYGDSAELDNLTGEETAGQLYRIVLGEELDVPSQQPSDKIQPTSLHPVAITLDQAKTFNHVKRSFKDLAEHYGYASFFQGVYPRQQKLVVDYTVEAFADLGTDLRDMAPGTLFSVTNYQSSFKMLYDQLCEMLMTEDLLVMRHGSYFRTAKSVHKSSTQQQYSDLVKDFPNFAKEFQLIDLFGRNLAELLRGSKNAIQLLFHEKANRELLAEVYAHGPMYNAVNELLAEFIEQIQSQNLSDRPLRVLEIGAGTGGTTKHILKRLSPDWNLEYTFSDVSPSFVQNAKRIFAKTNSMKYLVVDIEKTPPQHLCNYFDIIVSTNCIHATKNLQVTGTHIHEMLNEHGSVLLIEFTQNIPWFDLVFGFFDGWWLFEDGRKHALADIDVWKESLLAGGFQQVLWTNGDTQEEQTLRIIAGFKEYQQEQQEQISAPENATSFPDKRSMAQRAYSKMTYTYKEVDGLKLDLDVFVPNKTQQPGKRPIALMIHGGGHVMLSRDDIRKEQAVALLDLGFVPITIDYRLCPEVDLINGPMTDVVDAYQWIRESLTSLVGPYIEPDIQRIVIIGWSTGGTLALQMTWTTIDRGLPSPAAVLSFYCPTDYEDDLWQTPNYPNDTKNLSSQAYDLLDVLQEKPIAHYNVPTALGNSGNWFSTTDPRSRLILHMNWTGQCLPVLLHGSSSPIFRSSFPYEEKVSQPSKEEIQRISPLAHAKTGRIQTPVFIVHGDADDLVPASQSQRFVDTLCHSGIKAEIAIVPGQPHLFDVGLKLQRDTATGCCKSPAATEAIWQGLWFLLTNVGPTAKASNLEV